MKFCDYLGSRYVQSQIELNAKQVPSELARNQALKALMWCDLVTRTVFNFFKVLFQYFISLCFITPWPKQAQALMTEYKENTARAKEAQAAAAEKFSKQVLSDAMKERADAGLDSLPKTGNS